MTYIRAYDEKRTFPYRVWLYPARSRESLRHGMCDSVHAQAFVRHGDKVRLVAFCTPFMPLDPLRRVKHRRNRTRPVVCPRCVRWLKTHGLM